MTRSRFHASALLGACALLATTMLGAVPAAQAVDNGTIVVNVVDQYGRPTQSVVGTLDPDGHYQTEDGATGPDDFLVGLTHTYTVPAGGYVFLAITPWSGITCFGVTPCNLAAGSTDITPVLTVTGGSTNPYTLHVTVPSITGNPAVGSALSLTIPQSLKTLQSIAPSGTNPWTQQWVRGSTDIASATGASYTTVPVDGAQAITARLAPGDVQNALPQAYQGMTVGPLTTNAITLAPFVPAKTKTKVKLPHNIRAGDRVSLKVVVKAAGGEPDGTVTIKVGRSTVRRTLDNGSTFVNLPRLSAGTYKISVKYAGTEYFAKSKFKKKFTVLK